MQFLMLAAVAVCCMIILVDGQFMTKEQYNDYNRELQKQKEGAHKLNPLQELEDEVKEDGYAKP